MNNELKQVSDLFFESTTKRVKELYLDAPGDEVELTRVKADLNLWASYLENEARNESKRFAEEINRPRYAHINYHEKEEAIEKYRKNIKELIRVYNRNILRNVMSSINKKLMHKYEKTNTYQFN